MRRPRRLRPGAYHHVTVSTIRREFRLRPDPERTHLVGYWLGVVQARYPSIRLIAFIQMSNHLHLVLQDMDCVLDRFMGQFLGPLAKGLNKLDGVTGPVFDRRYNANEVVDSEALLATASYVILNSVKAGLVEAPKDWEGVLLWSGGVRTREFSRFRRRPYEQALNKARGDESKVCKEDFTDRVQVHIADPVLDDCPNFTAALASRVHTGVAELARARGSSKVLGSRRVRRQSPFQRPARPTRSPQPLCHSSCPETFRAFRDGWRAWLERFRDASRAFRAGALDVEFPPHAFRPWVPVLDEEPCGLSA